MHPSLRYLLVGTVLFLLDYAVTRAIHVEMKQPLVLAQWTGRLAGAGMGYWLHRAYTFANGGQLIGATRTRYVLVAVGLWLISPLLLNMAMSFTPTSLFWGKVFTEGALVCASYLLLRYFVFKVGAKP